MDWFTGIILFLLIWWTALFAVLPWGLQRDERGIPLKPNLKKKILQTTILTAVLWLFIYGLIAADIIDFREIARTMAREDHLQ